MQTKTHKVKTNDYSNEKAKITRKGRTRSYQKEGIKKR
jgi:hypothetical protein